MEITDIRIVKLNQDSKIKAYASITFDHQLVLHNIRIIEGNEGMFISMPNRKTKDGTFKDVAHPICTDFRKEIQDGVILAYNKLDE